MRKLSPDRKRYLLQQNRQMRSTIGCEPSISAPIYAASVGPSRAAQLLPAIIPQLTGDGGIIKRFSITNWGGTSIEVPERTLDLVTSNETSVANVSEDEKKDSDEQKPLQSQSTGGLWSSWWSSSGGEAASPTRQKVARETSASYYVDGIRASKSCDAKLVKLLISLRVRLSTAKLSWVEQFLRDNKGLEILGTLLASLVGKGGKRRKLVDIEDNALHEIIKCLRVLLNTEVGCFTFYQIT